MKNVLIINASSRDAKSKSKKLTKIFVEKWKNVNPNDNFIYREIGKGLIPHITEDWVEGAFKPEETRTDNEKKALQISDELVRELKDSDVVVLSTPMYNWSIPSSLKAYIDQVLRANETLAINPETPKSPYVGLLKNKKAFLILVRGGTGYANGEFYSHMDFQTTYLKTVFNIIGITDIESIIMDSADINEKESESSFQKCTHRINEVIK